MQQVIQETESQILISNALPETKEAPPELQSEQQFSYALFKSEKDNTPQIRKATWPEFVWIMEQHNARKSKAGTKAFSPVTVLADAKRSKDNVLTITMAVFDIDHGITPETVMEKLQGTAYFIHSTWSHTADNPSYRIVIPLTTPVTNADWPETWLKLNHLLGNINDAAVKDSSRLYYLPSHPEGRDDFFVKVGEGQFLDPNALPTLPVKDVAPAVINARPDISLPLNDASAEAPLGTEQQLATVQQRCNFVQWASDPDNQPQVSEPHWKSLISNLCRFEGGDEAIHDASCFHPEYDEIETEGRIERHREKSGPETCERIQALGFTGCPAGGCTLPSGNFTKAPAGLASWPYIVTDQVNVAEYKIGEFTVNKDGVFYDKIVKENVQVVRISSRIDVVARTCSANNDQWGSILEFKDPDGNAKRWALSSSMLSGNAEDVRKVILGMGAMIESGMAERGKFTSYLMTCDPSARALCVTQPGWHQAGDQQVYVTNDSAIGKTDLQIVLQTANPKAFEIFKKKGTVDEWKMHVANRCAGNSRLVMATCAALSAPVLHLMGLENMGLHFFGSSSIGKTIALKVAASAWGGGTIIQTWRATSNGLEAIASRHNDGLLCLDEMGQVNGKEVGETAYMLGNGQGKLRATIDAEAKDVRKFRLVYISNGEVAMRDHMQAAGKKVMAGQEVRLLNIPADAGAGFGIFDNITGSQNSGDFANEISRDALRYHGHAGLAFVEALSDAEQQGVLLDRIREKQLQFIQAYTPVSADGQVGRVGQKFAFMAAVGEVCTELGILPWAAGDAIAGARRCYMDWIEQRGGVGSLEEEQVVEQVRKYLEQHGESRFTLMGTLGLANDSMVKTINRAGFRESTNDDRTEYFVLPEVFKSEICAGLNPTYVSKVLADRGFLAVGKDGKPQVAKRLPSMGIKRVYRILPSIMGDDISESEAVVSEPAAVVSIEASVSEMAKRYIV